SDDIKNEEPNFVDIVYNFDWSSTLLGPMDSWEPALKTATDRYIELTRDGYSEESYFDYTFSPVLRPDGTVCAIYTLTQETTRRILNARRLKILSEFGHRISEIESLENACRLLTKVLNNNVDIPYALIYFVDHKSNSGSESLIARLIATTFDEDEP
ncbi:2419_t:CDS:2, partial [Dentiscutata heterogama]